MNHEEDHEHSCKLGNYGCHRRAIESHLWESSFTENEEIVEKYVRACLRRRSGHEVLALIGSHQQCIPHLVDVQQWQAPYSNVQELDCHIRRHWIVNDRTKNDRCK